MSNSIPPPADDESEQEKFPVEPSYHPIHKITRIMYDFLASARLAMALLVAILACCVVGVTVWRGTEAGRMIFGTIWFNALLVLLVLNVACCFFGRVWRRRITLVSFGMILFHLSFVAILMGVVYNSLFYFRGMIRLTEGEALPSGDQRSYENIVKGRFFSFSHFQGETALIKMHSGYKISGEDKRAAYEISVGESANRKQGIIYITNKLTHQGVDYFNDREGYSLLLILSDRQGRVLYGGHLPLQSIRQGDESFRYSTGYRDGEKIIPEPVLFPSPPEKPLMAMQVEYLPSKLQERAGDVQFKLFPLDSQGVSPIIKPYADEKAPIGQPVAVGEYVLSAPEVRYWVGMAVQYEPGKPIVLTSLWAGLAGMIITTLGRMLRGRKKVIS